MDIFQDIVDTTKYSILRVQPPAFSIPNRLDLKVNYDTKNKVLWCETPDLPGFTATGKNEKELLKEIFETLLVYFDIPRYFAKRMNEYGEMTMPDGKVVRLSNIRLKGDDLKYASA